MYLNLLAYMKCLIIIKYIHERICAIHCVCYYFFFKLNMMKLKWEKFIQTTTFLLSLIRKKNLILAAPLMKMMLCYMWILPEVLSNVAIFLILVLICTKLNMKIMNITNKIYVNYCRIQIYNKIFKRSINCNKKTFDNYRSY